MSRIGRSPVFFDDKVQVTVTPKNEVIVKGGKHSLAIQMRPEIAAALDGKKVVLTRKNETKEARLPERSDGSPLRGTVTLLGYIA